MSKGRSDTDERIINIMDPKEFVGADLSDKELGEPWDAVVEALEFLATIMADHEDRINKLEG